MSTLPSQQRPFVVGEVAELLAELIRNACVNDGTVASGGEERSVATLGAYLGEPGRTFEPAPGRTSVVYRVAGTDPQAPALALMGHLDVVPADAAAWRRDPFGGDRVDGWVWGRGAVDMLNQVAAMAAVFRPYLTGERAPLPGDLVFMALADEENGGAFGAQHLVEHEWEAVACDYLVTEIGTPRLDSTAGPVLPVVVAEKGPFWRRLRARGTPGHASQPHGRHDALGPLVDAVARLGAAPMPVAITAEWEAFVAALRLPAEQAAALVDPDRVDAAIDDVATNDPDLARWVHACTHLTVSPTVVRAGTKANVIAADARAEVDVRALPGQDETSVDDHFRKALGPGLYEDVEIAAVNDHPATGSAPSGPLWEAIRDAHEHVAGSSLLAPALSPVATDARYFRPRGTVAYGVALFDDDTPFGAALAMFHGNDERVSEASLGRTAGLYAAMLDRFATLCR